MVVAFDSFLSGFNVIRVLTALIPRQKATAHGFCRAVQAEHKLWFPNLETKENNKHSKYWPGKTDFVWIIPKQSSRNLLANSTCLCRNYAY